MNRFLAKPLALAATLATAVALSACGGSDKPSDPLDNALQYLPKDAPFVAAIGTDLQGSQAGALEDIVKKFPFGGAVVKQIQEEIEDQAGDFETLKELLGNDFVVGSTSAKDFTGTPSGEDEAFVGAIEAKDADKLEEQVKKEGKEDGEKDGAKIYKNDDTVIAIQDGTLIVAGNRKQLEAAIERHGGDDHFTQKDFEDGIGSVDDDSLVRAYFDVAGLLEADPDTRQARKIKWVAALEGFGLGAKATSDSIDIDFDLTTKSGLADSDLPLAAGSASPEVVDRKGALGIGVRDPGQIVTFAEAAGKAISPGGFAQYESGKQQIDKSIGVNLNDDLVEQLEGDLALSVTLDGKFGARAQLKDPAAMEKTLAALGKVAPAIAKGATGETVGYAKPKAGSKAPFYALATKDGDSIVYGVIDENLVVANDPKLAGAIAKEPASPVQGAKGSLAAQADAQQLGNELVKEFADALGFGSALGGNLVTGPLGQLTGSIESSTSGMSGNLSLTFD